MQRLERIPTSTRDTPPPQKGHKRCGDRPLGQHPTSSGPSLAVSARHGEKRR